MLINSFAKYNYRNWFLSKFIELRQYSVKLGGINLYFIHTYTYSPIAEISFFSKILKCIPCRNCNSKTKAAFFLQNVMSCARIEITNARVEITDTRVRYTLRIRSRRGPRGVRVAASQEFLIFVRNKERIVGKGNNKSARKEPYGHPRISRRQHTVLYIFQLDGDIFRKGVLFIYFIRSWEAQGSSEVEIKFSLHTATTREG